MSKLNPLTNATDAEDRPHWRRRLIIGVLLVLMLGLGFIFYRYHQGIRRLERAIADADRLDPGWRMEELEAKRASIPDDQNSALVILAVWKEIEKQLAIRPLTVESQPLPERPPPVQLTEAETKRLRHDMERAAPQLREAHKLIDMPRGRFPVSPARDFPGGYPIDHVQRVRATMNVLSYDAMLRVQDGNIDGALQSCRGIVNAGRSLGDEPTLISMLVRLSCRSVAVYHLERVLAKGQAAEAELLATQRQLETEAQEPLLLTSARGERAYCHAVIQMLKEGPTDSSFFEKFGMQPSAGSELRGPFAALTWNNDHAVMLELMNQCVAIAKLPLQEQVQPMKELEERFKDPNQPSLVRLLTPATRKIFEAHRKGLAFLECSIVALAAERHRLAHGRWPDSLEELTPWFLSKVPGDPYGKGPLRLARQSDRIVIYSVYIDGIDNGGKVPDDVRPVPGIDIGVRLWDVKHRRQPAPVESGEERKEQP